MVPMPKSFLYSQLEHRSLEKALEDDRIIKIVLSERRGKRLQALLRNVDDLRHHSQGRAKRNLVMALLRCAWLIPSTFLFHQKLWHAFGLYLEESPDHSVIKNNAEVVVTFWLKEDGSGPRTSRP